MTARIAKAAFAACLLTLLPGCVELTQTITLNPDGKGKMKIEIKVASFRLRHGGRLWGAWREESEIAE